MLCVAGASCRRDIDDARLPNPATHPKTNVVSKVDEKGRLTEKLVYATSGLLKHRTFFETEANGRVTSSRTIDGEDKPKWTEKYFYEETSGARLSKVQRIQPDGKIVVVHFLYAIDGTKRRIVIGPDGKEIPIANQEAFLEE